MLDFEVLDARISSALKKQSRTPASRRRSVWRNKKHKKRTVSIVEDNLPDLRILPGHGGPTILSRIIQTFFYRMRGPRSTSVDGSQPRRNCALH